MYTFSWSWQYHMARSHIHTYIYIHVHTYICIYIYIFNTIHTCIHMCIGWACSTAWRERTRLRAAASAGIADEHARASGAHCISLQHISTHWNTLQHLQHTAAHYTVELQMSMHEHLVHTATHRNTLQHAATHCNTLQHTTAHCNTHNFGRARVSIW